MKIALIIGLSLFSGYAAGRCHAAWKRMKMLRHAQREWEKIEKELASYHDYRTWADRRDGCPNPLNAEVDMADPQNWGAA